VCVTGGLGGRNLEVLGLERGRLRTASTASRPLYYNPQPRQISPRFSNSWSRNAPVSSQLESLDHALTVERQRYGPDLPQKFYPCVTIRFHSALTARYEGLVEF